MNTLNIPISVDQLIRMINQLPLKQRLKLSKELERDFVEQRLSKLLASFKTDDVSEEIILRESETVRKELYGASQNNSRRR